MAALILLLLSSYGLGGLFRNKAAPELYGRYFYCASRLTAGMGIWCLLLFIMGLSGLLKPVPITIVAALSSGFTLCSLFRQRLLQVHIRPPKLSVIEWILVCSGLFFLLLTFIAAFSPVTGGIANDEIHTHLSVPAAWLRSGTIAPQPYPASFMAANGELLFLFGTIFSRDTGPHLISWSAFVLTIVFVYSIARQFLERTPSLIAAVITIVNPLLFRGAPIAFVDSLSMQFMVAALATYVRWRREPALLPLAMAAFFAGIGCGVKPTCVIYAAVLAIPVIIDTIKNPPGFRLRRVTIAAAVVIITAAIWPVRLLMHTGSPTFPPPPGWMAAELPQKVLKVPVPYTKADIDGFYRYVYSRYGDYKRSWSRFLAVPWEMTMQPEQFQIGDSIGTTLLSLLPIALVIMVASGNYRKMTLLPAFSFLSISAIYAFVLPEARYFGTAICALAPVMALPFARDPANRLLRAGCLCVLFVNILFSTAVAVRIESGNIRMVIDKQYRERRQREHTPFYEALQFIAENRQGRSLVVLYDSPIWYYLPGPYIVDGDACRHPDKYPDALLLDIDFSQVIGRSPGSRSGDYAIARTPRLLQPLFEGPDARVYQFTHIN